MPYRETQRRRLRLAFSTKLAHLLNKPPGTTYRVRPGLIDSSQNWNALEAKCWVMHSDVLSNTFDSTLEKYGLCKLRQVALLEPPVNNADLLEIWDYYVTHPDTNSNLSEIESPKELIKSLQEQLKTQQELIASLQFQHKKD